MIAEIEKKKPNDLVQTNKLLFQRFREKYEKMKIVTPVTLNTLHLPFTGKCSRIALQIYNASKG